MFGSAVNHSMAKLLLSQWKQLGKVWQTLLSAFQAFIFLISIISLKFPNLDIQTWLNFKGIAIVLLEF